MPFIRTPGGAFVPAGGGGGGITDIPVNGVALIDAVNGNDTTGTVGDLSLPYATMQEAFDDGCRYFLLAAKATPYAGITTTGAVVITILPLGGITGYSYVSISNITTTGAANAVHITNVGSPSSLTVANVLSTPSLGVGGEVKLSNLTSIAVYASGSTGANDGTGYSAGSIEFNNCILSGNVYCSGGNGGSLTGFNNGTEGGLGGTVRVYNSFIANDSTVIYANGGGGSAASGPGGGARTGGVGGAAGTIYLVGVTGAPTIASGIIAAYGGPGGNGEAPDMYMAGAGSGGLGGNGGNVNLHGTYLPGTSIASGGGSSGNNGGSGLADSAGGNGGPITLYNSCAYVLSATGGSCGGVYTSNGGNIYLRNSTVLNSADAQPGGAGTSGDINMYLSFVASKFGNVVGGGNYYDSAWHS